MYVCMYVRMAGCITLSPGEEVETVAAALEDMMEIDFEEDLWFSEGFLLLLLPLLP